jgi:hypothetical protein
MTDIPSLQLTIDFSDSELAHNDLEQITQSLFRDMSSLSEVEQVNRVREQPPQGVKAGAEDLGKWLTGLLTAEISFPNITPIMKFLFNRLVGKNITLRAIANGRRIELKACGASQEEILAIIQELKDFAEGS